MHHEAKDRDPVWDCTLIKSMREHNDTIVSPIYEWTDTDIWDYIQRENIDVNILYSRGYTRVGCIGCPMATYKQKMKEFADYPKYKDAYIRAFQRMVDKREADGKEQRESWKDGESVYKWWIEEYRRNIKGQLKIGDNGELETI